MTKRASGKFARAPRDLYSTPAKAVPCLIPHLFYKSFAEPCAGKGALVGHLESLGLTCTYRGDIATGQDALKWQQGDEDDHEHIITNPPWSWPLLTPLLNHFIFTCRKTTWLLLDADLAHNVRMRPYMLRCFKIVSVGRLKWIPDSKHQGFDNAAWYGFDAHHYMKYPEFVPR